MAALPGPARRTNDLQRASDLPAAAPHTASQHPISLSSRRPATCSSIERSEVPRCPPNGPTIDGKDGVAGSIPAGGSTKQMTSRNAGHCSRSRPVNRRSWPSWHAEWRWMGACRMESTSLVNHSGCGRACPRPLPVRVLPLARCRAQGAVRTMASSGSTGLPDGRKRQPRPWSHSPTPVQWPRESQRMVGGNW
jgi:hypothetical protein